MNIQVAILEKIVEQKYERNDQQHALLPRKSNKNVPPDFLKQQEVQKNQARKKKTKKHVTVFKNMSSTRQSFRTKYYWTKNSSYQQSS